MSEDEAVGENGRKNEAGSPESAADYVRGSGTPAPSHEGSYGARQARARAEEARLIEWAAGAGKLGGKIPVHEDRGGEHLVSYDPKSNRYLKSTRPEANLGYGLALTDSGLAVFQRATPEFARFIADNYTRLPDYQNAEGRAWDAAL